MFSLITQYLNLVLWDINDTILRIGCIYFIFFTHACSFEEGKQKLYAIKLLHVIKMLYVMKLLNRKKKLLKDLIHKQV